MSIPLVGVGMDHSEYQIGVLHSAFPLSWPDSGNTMKPIITICLCRKSDGALIWAKDMPIKTRVGFLKQGKKDKFGDKGVFHAKATGMIIPPEVESSLSSALTPHPLDPSQCYFVNNANNQYNKFFVVRSASYSTLTRWRFQWPTNNSWQQVLNQKTYTGNTELKYVDGFYIWTVTTKGQTVEYEITHRFSALGINKCQGTTAPNITTGSCTVKSRLLPNGSWKTTQYAADSKVTFQAFSAPTYLSSITTQVVFSGSAAGFMDLVNRDLMDLSEVDPGNAPWLSCYSAVESLKHMNFQWATYLRDTLEAKKLITPIRNFLKVAKLNPKMIADLYLWWIYGVKPQAGDTLKLTKKIIELKGRSVMGLAQEFSSLASRYGTYQTTSDLHGYSVSVKCNTRVRLRPRLTARNQVEILFQFMQSLDLGIDATNVWEFLPYSFVVDWFMDSDEMAKWFKYTTYSNIYDLRQLIASTKSIVEVPANRYVTGSYSPKITLTTYQRGIHNMFPTMPFDLSFNSDFENHVLEASALLVAKKG